MIISLKGIANSTGVILKGIINSTDVIFFALAILPLLIKIVLLLNYPEIQSIIQTVLLILRFGQMYHRHFSHISLFLIIRFA